MRISNDKNIIEKIVEIRSKKHNSFEKIQKISQFGAKWQSIFQKSY